MRITGSKFKVTEKILLLLFIFLGVQNDFLLFLSNKHNSYIISNSEVHKSYSTN